MTNRKPLQKYNPRSLDEKDTETLKMGITEELWEISNNFVQTDEILGDTFEKVTVLEIDRDHANARIEEIYRLSVEDDKILAEKITELSADLDINGNQLSAQITEEARVRAEKDLALAETITTLSAEVTKGDNLLASQIVETNKVISDLEKTTAENKLELNSSISSVKDTAKSELEAAEAALAEAIAKGDKEEAERLRAEIARLQGIIDANKADIEAKLKVTNTTIAELDKAMAENKLELEASIKSSSDEVMDWVDMTQKDLTADYTAKVQAVASDLSITNKALTTLEGTMAENKTELNSKIDNVSFDLADTKQKIAGEIGSLESSLGVTNKTMTELTKTVAENKTELSSAIKDVDVKVGGVKVEIGKLESDLVVTNKTVTDLTSTVASNKTELSSSIKGVQDGASADATAKTEAAKAEAQKALTAAQTALDKAIKDGDTAEAAKLKAEIDRLTGVINSNKTDIEAKLTVTNTTVANLDKSMASQITNLQSDYNGKFSTVNQTLSTTVNKVGAVEAKWGVSVDANGSIGGVQLIGSGTAGTEFSVRADRFRLTDGANKFQPMYVENNVVTLSNLIIKGTCVFQGSIDSSQITDTAVTAVNKMSTDVNASTGVGVAEINAPLSTATINHARNYARSVQFVYPGSIHMTGKKAGSGSKKIMTKLLMYYNGGLISEAIHSNSSTTSDYNYDVSGTIVGTIPAGTTGTVQINAYIYFQDAGALTVRAHSQNSQFSIFKVSNEIS